MEKRIRPAKRLMNAGGQCSKEGLAYGECVLQNYSNMQHKGCDKEFVMFKNCVSKVMGKGW